MESAGSRHLGILAHSVEGAALCFREFCRQGFAEFGPDEHPDVTLDCIALARSMPSWDSGEHDKIREILSVSVHRLARAGADFFVCPDNTAHMALERPGPDLALPGLHIADGSVMPGPTGPNPSFTIAALADRFADQIIDPDRRAAEAAGP